MGDVDVNDVRGWVKIYPKEKKIIRLSLKSYLFPAMSFSINSRLPLVQTS